VGWYEKIRNLDRRVIFLMIGLSVVVPLLLVIRFPEYPTPMVKDTFRIVESLPAGSKVLFVFDYDPSMDPELQPMSTAWLRHCAEKRLRVYICSLWPLGQDLARDTVAQVKKDLLRKEKETGVRIPFEYGVDYVNLGYKSGDKGVINVMLTNIEKIYPTDVTNRAVSSLPMMQSVRSLRDFDLIIDVSGGEPGTKEWIQFGSDPAGVKIIGGSTAVQAPQLYPYYPRQLAGLLSGLKPAAEYEQLLGEKYPQYADIRDNKGRIRMGAQAIAHIVIMAFIVIGNITYFLDRRRKTK